MKVKVWIRKDIEVEKVESKDIRALLVSNGISHFSTYEEEILDFDLERIFVPPTIKNKKGGYQYYNKLYDFVHLKATIGKDEKRDKLEFEIIEEGFPKTIPYAEQEFDNVEDFEKWLRKEFLKEKEMEERKWIK